MSDSRLLPNPGLLHLGHIITDTSAIVVMVATTPPTARCPHCDYQAVRVHSHYHRTLADVPWHGVAVRLRLRTRRFFCDNPTCSQAIFTEPLPGVAQRYARRTMRLQEAFQLIALCVGGEAGARLARELGMGSSPDTLLRVLRRAAPTDCPTPRVLGVDDFAFRRGRTYGTILVDLEKHRVVDLLPDREIKTLAAWLKRHPEIEIVSRDRSSAYAQAIRQGAPNALQVADRWHLLKNLVNALEKLLIREHPALRTVVRLQRDQSERERTGGMVRPISDVPPDPPLLPSPPVSPSLSPRFEQEKQQRRERRLARYRQIMELYNQGATLREIARATRVSRETVRRFVQAGEFLEMTPRQPRPTKLDGFHDYIQARWDAGCHSSAQLLRELREQGYNGGHTIVKDHVRTLRAILPRAPAVQSATQSGTQEQQNPVLEQPVNYVPPVRSVLWWLLQPDEQLDGRARQFVRELCQINAFLGTARELALWFFRMVRERKSNEFGEWLAFARESRLPYLKNFAQGLLSDRSAVVAALSSEWSNGQTEGQVNRLKLIKRQMYGRAGFALLRARVLAAA